MSARGDAVFATRVTFVAPRSTYTGDVSKKPGLVDTFAERVDGIDALWGRVDIP